MSPYWTAEERDGHAVYGPRGERTAGYSPIWTPARGEGVRIAEGLTREDAETFASALNDREFAERVDSFLQPASRLATGFDRSTEDTAASPVEGPQPAHVHQEEPDETCFCTGGESCL